jgi:glycosyltransferase involved in cell wall biosynthesis
MRVAYLAVYQGRELLKRRPSVLNRSLANAVAIELMAQALRASSHQVEIISQGEVVENKFKFYPSFCEPETIHPDIPVYYSSSLPVRRLNALWSSICMLRLFRARHAASPYDIVIIHNLKHPQIICADYAIRRLGIPVVLEYDDDPFVSISGGATRHSFGYCRYASRVLTEVSGCVGRSPRLLSQVPPGVPKLLLRGLVGADLVNFRERNGAVKKNWVLFSGTHTEQYGIPSLIAGWSKAELPDWELHITGEGPDTNALKTLAENKRGIRFHGLVSRQELLRLMCSSRICINPHQLSQIPGNVFAFKIIEYLAAGAHVITTPMGALEEGIEAGITYMHDNDSDTIAMTLKQVVLDRRWERTAAQHVLQTYGPAAVSKSLEVLIQKALALRTASAG